MKQNKYQERRRANFVGIVTNAKEYDQHTNRRKWFLIVLTQVHNMMVKSR
jgi:hypothetical protein